VDSATEAIMQEIIDTEFRDCTVIAIMHHLEYAERYNRVAVMDNGVLVEEGEPAVLAATDTQYAKLCRLRA
jgi:ATP-binding cassette, subfamily C (CFTR/MRP), member 1